jgi:hypothetical protein
LAAVLKLVELIVLAAVIHHANDIAAAWAAEARRSGATLPFGFRWRRRYIHDANERRRKIVAGGGEARRDRIESPL